MNKELMISGNVPFLSWGILCVLAQCGVHRPQRTQSCGSAGNTMLCQPLSSLWGRQKELRDTECPQSPEKQGFKLLSAWGFTVHLLAQMAHIWASGSSMSPTQVPLRRGSRDPVLMEHSWLSPSFSSWRSKSEGSLPVVFACYWTWGHTTCAQNIFHHTSSINQLKEPNR